MALFVPHLTRRSTIPSSECWRFNEFLTINLILSCCYILERIGERVLYLLEATFDISSFSGSESELKFILSKNCFWQRLTILGNIKIVATFRILRFKFNHLTLSWWNVAILFWKRQWSRCVKNIVYIKKRLELSFYKSYCILIDIFIYLYKYEYLDKQILEKFNSFFLYDIKFIKFVVKSTITL